MNARASSRSPRNRKTNLIIAKAVLGLQTAAVHRLRSSRRRFNWPELKLCRTSPRARIRACRLAGGPRFAFAAPLSGLYPFRYREHAKAREWVPRGFDGF